MAKMRSVEVLVIGGGVNGCGIARDLAGRGISTMLVEKDDLASATSSASTKLIHGGLRYLEYYEFRLVREALSEREVLLRSAPHIIKPMKFVLPHHKKLRPWWLVKLGLFVYDHLGGRKMLPPSESVLFSSSKLGYPLKNIFERGFTYYDCWVDDARLVVLNALDAYEKGAQILTRTQCLKIESHPKEVGWVVTLRDNITEAKFKVFAKTIVNAAGPWVNKVLDSVGSGISTHTMRWVKGSHIIVNRLYKGDHAYILQNQDKRIVFAIPYEGKYTLIGTTDVDYGASLEEVRISVDEVEYLCNSVNRFFKQQLTPEDVEWAYSGVRPLLDDGGEEASSVTRDYVLEVDEYQGASIVNIYGGKITTFRRLSEQVGNKVVSILSVGRKAWTKKASMPGAEGTAKDFKVFFKAFADEYRWLPKTLINRYAHSYGSRAREFLRGVKSVEDLGKDLGDDVYEVEIKYLVDFEWALTMDDILFRRSKLGLHISDETYKNIEKLLKKILKAKAN